mmetsp:Transcript_21795/g.29208  ORF Transcript_21795/g.29208 Transcript_21795/m.29208 type:complete len:84 (+) Transcript_21795:239-490(+)
MKDVFAYRIVNDSLEVSKRVADLLISGLYTEELLEQSTDTLIAETPLIQKAGPGIGQKLKIAAAATVVAGVVGIAAIFMMRRN